MNKRFKAIPSVYLILIKDGKTLLLQRQNTGYEDGNRGLVAGHMDGEESAREAMCREAKEESGITVKSEDLKVVHVMHRIQDDERIDFFLATDKWEGEIQNTEPEKCSDLSWFPIDSLPENTIPYIKQALEHIQRGSFYSEFGWNRFKKTGYVKF